MPNYYNERVVCLNNCLRLTVNFAVMLVWCHRGVWLDWVYYLLDSLLSNLEGKHNYCSSLHSALLVSSSFACYFTRVNLPSLHLYCFMLFRKLYKLGIVFLFLAFKKKFTLLCLMAAFVRTYACCSTTSYFVVHA